jgi:tetratricopeptide (TPR) repeat protein
VHSHERWKLIEATDTTTGRPARLAHIRITERSHFLDGFEVEAMLARVRAIGDPRLATVICDDPVAFDGPAHDQPPTGRPEDWRRLGLDLLEVMILLNGQGVRALPGWAWAERRDGRLALVVPAPVFVGLHTHNPSSNWVAQSAQWVRSRLGKSAGRRVKAPDRLSHEQHLAAFCKELRVGADAEAQRRLEAAFEAGRSLPELRPIDLDFDRAIEAGQEAYEAPYVDWALAAALHHRGCVRAKAGALTEGIADVDRALALDPHTRYFTTRALLTERASSLETPIRQDAGSFHDQAIERHQTPVDAWTDDPAETKARDAARAFYARGWYRRRQGDVAGALADLEAAAKRSTNPKLAAALAATRALAAR